MTFERTLLSFLATLPLLAGCTASTTTNTSAAAGPGASSDSAAAAAPASPADARAQAFLAGAGQTDAAGHEWGKGAIRQDIAAGEDELANQRTRVEQSCPAPIPEMEIDAAGFHVGTWHGPDMGPRMALLKCSQFYSALAFWCESSSKLSPEEQKIALAELKGLRCVPHSQTQSILDSGERCDDLSFKWTDQAFGNELSSADGVFTLGTHVCSRGVSEAVSDYINPNL